MATTGALVSNVCKQLLTTLSEQAKVNLNEDSCKEIMELTNAFKSIQAVLQVAEDERFTLTKSIQTCLDIAYDMDDVLDELITEMVAPAPAPAPATTSSDKTIMNKKKEVLFSFILASLCCFSSSFTSVILRQDNNIVSRIREINQRLECLIASGSTEIGRNIKDEQDVCCQTIDKDFIISRLLADQITSDTTGSSSSNMPQSRSVVPSSHPIIVPIVGGEIGKISRLEQQLFNDKKVKKHFKMCMWVCVSETFSLYRIALEIMEQVGCSSLHSYEPKDLYHFLSQTVEKKRFLLVIENVQRSVNLVKWESLMDILSSGAQGSRILVTTRYGEVANRISLTNNTQLGTLSDDDWWSLCRQIAFVGRDREAAEEQEAAGLNEIGFRIAQKCKGLPLAAETLGRLLCFKHTTVDWVVDWVVNGRMILEDFRKSFGPLLSYNGLQSTLRGCFAYCSIFPKGHKINKDVLIKLWMAQGFLHSTTGTEKLEMIGEKYINELVLCSFLQDLSKDESGNIISFKMHDLLHDLVQLAPENDCYVTQDNTHILSSIRNIRHLSLICEDKVDSRSFPASVYNAKHLRTFQLLTNELNSPLREIPSNFFHSLKCLRVLCFSKIGLESLSNEIGELIHLRYLDLSGNCMLRELPESMANLYNLQTLELKGCHSLCKLPKEMCRMVNLRHLNIENTPSLSYLPKGFGKLSSLQTLSRFIVSDAAKGCTIKELEDLNQLNGKIKIEGLDMVKTIEEASKAELKNKNLWGLILDFKCNDEGENKNLGSLMADRMKGMLAVLQPHPNLKELEIRFYLGSQLSRWIVESPMLSHLNSLVLQDCINCTELPALEQLPSLETLIIHRLHNLKTLCHSNDGRHANNIAFPKLKHLEICDMKSLVTWDLGYKEQVGDIMPCIRYVRLGCQKMQTFPSLWKLASLETLKIETTGDVKHTERGFYYNAIVGRSVDSIAFPMLKHLEICDLNSLEVWDLGDGEGVEEIMPCLRYLKLSCCRLKAFPALWKLPSLETLEIGTTGNVKHIGVEFHGNYGICAGRVAFPKLKKLFINDMNLKVWDLGDGVVRQIMPCLHHVKLHCPKLKELPALGELQSLEVLDITAEEIKQIGFEFYRNGCDGVAFPSLKELHFLSMSSLEVWDLGEEQFMPCLHHVKLHCPKLKELPALGELQSLEVLDITAEEIKQIGFEFYRNGCDGVAFPSLKELHFLSMSSLEVWDLGEEQFMPCLRQLKLNCPNLKSWPALERLPSLEVLDIVLDEEETHIGCEFYGLSNGERLHSWYEKIEGMGLWRIRRRRNR